MFTCYSVYVSYSFHRNSLFVNNAPNVFQIRNKSLDSAKCQVSAFQMCHVSGLSMGREPRGQGPYWPENLGARDQAGSGLTPRHGGAYCCAPYCNTEIRNTIGNSIGNSIGNTIRNTIGNI